MKYIFSLIFLFFSVIGLGQCEVYIVPGSSTVIDHNPGISFVFEVQNDSDTPYLGGDLYLNWALSGGASGPIWEFDFGVLPVLPGESKYISTPSFDVPLPENVPGNWYSYGGWTGDNYFPPGWALFLDDEPSCWDYVLDDTQVNGYFNNPLSDNCSNLDGDMFCDNQCNFELIDFNLETAELTLIPTSTYCPNIGSYVWQSQYPFNNPYIFGFTLRFGLGPSQYNFQIGGQQIYESGDPIVIDLSDLLTNPSYEGMIEDIENGEICNLDVTLYNANNTGQAIWEVSDDQTIEISDLCSVLENVDLSLDTVLYDVGCEYSPPLWDEGVPYWVPELHLTNEGDTPITEWCVNFSVLGQINDTVCFNNTTILPGETYIQGWPNVYDWGVLSIHILHVNGVSENWWEDFGEDNSITNNMYVQVISNEGFCEPEEIPGCTDINAINYNPLATIDDGSCIDPIIGCMIPDALNYNPEANITCEPIIECCIFPIEGCIDPEASNYNPEANVDDGSCEYDVYGCTNQLASNYNPLATIDDGSCVIILAGCTDPEAINYNPSAIEDDGSCVYDDICNGIYAPNTFSPNNDGVNDIWTLVTDPSCWLDWHIIIYNRWGQIVWESTTPGEVWVGSHSKGNHYIADGVYIYTARGIGYNPSNTFQKSGYITIFR